MGYNTGIVIYNDHVRDLETPMAGLLIAEAMRNWQVAGYHAQDRHQYRHLLNFGFGMVVSQNHSSESSIIAIGGNYGNVLHRTHLSAHHEKHQQLQLLRDWAEREGFDLVPKKKLGPQLTERELKEYSGGY